MNLASFGYRPIIGLTRFNPNDFSFNIFYKKDGIADNEFNRFSYKKTKDGKIYLGGMNGITGFDPKDFLYLDSLNTPLLISNLKRLKINEKDFQKIPITDNQAMGLTMETDDKSLVVDFGLLDYANSFQSTYAYKIEGYDEDWINLPKNQLTINRLPYGDYQLKVKAKGSQETWTNQILELPIAVLRPFYLTWQFLLLGVLAMIGLTYGITRWRLRQLENRNLELEKVVAERTKELADLNQTKDQLFAIIGHDMRGLVMYFKDISKKINFLQQQGRKEDVSGFLQDIDNAADNLSHLLDNLLNWALVERSIFPYRPEEFNLERLVIENASLFTQLSRIKNIQLNYDVHKTLNIHADRNAVSTVIRNLISNAIKFCSEGDQVTVEAYKKDGEIQIRIIDTGEGIASNKLEDIFKLDSKKTERGTMGERGTGLGLVLCKELTQLNNGNIKIESEEGKGTCVILRFPLAA